MADWDSGDDDSRMGGMLDQENALGGGGSSWGFSSFRGLDRGTGLPPPPAAYEGGLALSLAAWRDLRTPVSCSKEI